MTATILVTGAGGAPPPPGEPPPPGGDPAPVDDPPQAAPGGIAIFDNGYSPASRTITTGTTLVWTNTGAIPHTVSATAGGFDSGILLSGATYRRTFTQPGTFDYFCTIHPSMKGMVNPNH
jgi:plastocyanin